MMKRKLIPLALIALAGICCWGQAQPSNDSQSSAPAQTSATQGCGKNVSFAVAEGGQPVPAIPKFAVKWLESKAPRQHYSNLCFSQIPSASLPNYVVVFSTTDAAFDNLTPSAHTYTTTAPAHTSTAALTSSGGTWTYAYAGSAPPATTDTLSLKRDDKPKELVARAYDQSGHVVSKVNLASISSRDKLIEKVLSDIIADTPHQMAKSAVPSPFPVYYVNCDIDAPQASPPVNGGPAAAAARTETASAAVKPAAAPDPEIDIWSDPGGADVFVDGAFVGKTPYTMSVTQGDHTITLRKHGYGVWQRKMYVGGAKRKVGGSLEIKELDLK
jgi:hypothetical protein